MSDPDLAGRRPRVNRVRSWFTGQPRAGHAWPRSPGAWAVDVAITAVVLAAELGGSHAAGTWNPHMHHHPAPGVAAYVLLAVGAVSLLARRRYPVAVLAVTLVTAIAAMALNADVVWFALTVAFLTAVVARERAAAIASLVIGYVAAVWPPWLIGQSNHASITFALGLAAGLAFLLIIAELIRIRSQQAAAVALGREEELRRRASEERMRMARDLHDVVAHNIAVINVQANTALHLMDRQPERARSALVTINDVSKQALVELRSVLGVLRDVDEASGSPRSPRSPAPGLARLDDLTEHAAAAGLTVRVEEDGQRAALPADVDLTAYRIIQEALTNSARHSGGAHATVRLRHGEDALLIEVDDDGRPDGRTGHAGGGSHQGGGSAHHGGGSAHQGGGSGNGIAGMTERAAALGGTLEARPRAGGGFAVRAWLPLRRSEA